MKICAVQVNPVKGDIERNIALHKKLIDLAVSNGADLIIFPELSLTGYEPSLAKELATSGEDSRFDDFQKISDAKQVIIGVGVPTKADSGILISMIIFQPRQARQTYSKQYLHTDELPFFINGKEAVLLKVSNKIIAPAICYESLVPEHSNKAFKSGAAIYFASVAKSAGGVEKAASHFPAIAKKYCMTVMMSNSTGYCDNFECAGKTAVWNNRGFLAGQLNSSSEGILIFDTDTEEIVEKII